MLKAAKVKFVNSNILGLKKAIIYVAPLISALLPSALKTWDKWFRQIRNKWLCRKIHIKIILI